MTIFEITFFGITIAPTYYGLMYVFGFLAGFHIIKKRGKIIPKTDTHYYSKKEFNNLQDSLFFYIFMGVIVGGRFGYVLFYNFFTYIKNPLDIFKVWEGGMSFHGGVIGVVIAMLLFSKIHKVKFLKLADQVTLIIPIGLGLGRIGNYLNNELLGYSGYEGIFAIFINGNSYFPSTLLEALLEGLLLFIILNIVYLFKIKFKKIKDGQIATLFLIFYAIFRIIVEIFFRVPDSHIGYIMGIFTMGEILTIPMFILGLIIYFMLNSSSNYGDYTEKNSQDSLISLRRDINDIDDSLLKSLKVLKVNGYKFTEKDFSQIIKESSTKTISDLYNKKEPIYPVVVLLEMRFKKVIEVGKIKAIENITVLQSNRWNEVLENAKSKAALLGLDQNQIVIFWNMIHEKAIELEKNV